MAIQKKAVSSSATPINRGQTGGQAVSRASQAAQPGQVFASLNPADFTAGGLLDDVDVTFASVRFCEWDYNGAVDHPVLALLVSMEYQDADGKQATAEQYYSAGDLNRFVPSEDGSHAIAVGNAKGLAGGTNAATFLKSVFDAGFPIDRLGDGDVSKLEGTVAHINRQAQQKRGGNISGKTTSGYEATVAVVTKIHKMPWETAKAGSVNAAKAVSKPNGRVAPAQTQAPLEENEQADTGVQEEAAGILLAVLEAKGGSVKKMGIAPGSFKLLAGNPSRSAILNLLASEDFLNLGEDYGWTYDGQNVEMLR